MTTSAFVGNFLFKRFSTAASPNGYVTVPEVFSISGIGEANDQVGATSFDSGGNREWIGGLADGQEVTIEANYVANSVEQEAFITDVKNKTSRLFKVVQTHSSPNTSFSFTAACLSWVVNPSVDDRDTITFTVKISGTVTVG